MLVVGFSNTARIGSVEFLSLSKTFSDINNSLVVGLILQANLTQSQQSLANLHLDGTLLFFLGERIYLVCVSDLGKFQHLPGKLKIAGVLFFLSLLCFFVLSLLSIISNALSILFVLSLFSGLSRLRVFSFCGSRSLALDLLSLLSFLCFLTSLFLVFITLSIFSFFLSGVFPLVLILFLLL